LRAAGAGLQAQAAGMALRICHGRRLHGKACRISPLRQGPPARGAL
jgi:hypothetical protein